MLDSYVPLIKIPLIIYISYFTIFIYVHLSTPYFIYLCCYVIQQSTFYILFFYFSSYHFTFIYLLVQLLVLPVYRVVILNFLYSYYSYLFNYQFYLSYIQELTQNIIAVTKANVILAIKMMPSDNIQKLFKHYNLFTLFMSAKWIGKFGYELTRKL